MDFNEARTKYQSRMNVLIEQSRSKKIEKNILFTELVRIGDIFCTDIESIICEKISSILSPAEKNDLLETIEETFKTVIKHYKILKKLSQKINYESPNTVIIFLQNVYKSNAEKNSIKEYKKKFADEGLSVKGFETRRKSKMKTTKCNVPGIIITAIVTLLIIAALVIYNNIGKNISINIPMLITAVIALGICIIFCFIKFVQDSSSYLIFRILASLAPSILLVSLINVTVRISLTFRILTLDAIGVVALTVFFYLVKPAKPQEYKTASELKQDN